MLFGVEDFPWDERRWVSVWFGLLAFWCGLSFMNSDSEWTKALYCLINLGLMAVSLLLERRAFIVFGAMGVFGYFGHLAYHVFENSLMFPFALTILGVTIIFLGIQFQKNGAKLQGAVLAHLPAVILQRLPRQRTRHGPAPH